MTTPPTPLEERKSSCPPVPRHSSGGLAELLWGARSLDLQVSFLPAVWGQGDSKPQAGLTDRVGQARSPKTGSIAHIRWGLLWWPSDNCGGGGPAARFPGFAVTKHEVRAVTRGMPRRAQGPRCNPRTRLPGRCFLDHLGGKKAVMAIALAWTHCFPGRSFWEGSEGTPPGRGGGTLSWGWLKAPL